MFENYKEMTDAEKASVKAIHKALRAETAGRYGNLAWGFVRGFPYRRIERTTRVQTMADGSVVNHNPLDARYLTHLLGKLVPGFAVIDEKQSWNTKPSRAIEAWLDDSAGAIPVPVRVKLTPEEARARHEGRKVA